ncbi:S-layer homology domain-containing protein [uncultured Brevibacillus sp.]|uniref:S-layer homology domain-containing protein n=1 Tax=uncultured Brevibacillus sp. TaxID=169970 RepID=UPI002596DAF4|nr:S-layer homology domain-containing protein [uncultured Brevibacillus sp.]
MAVMMSLMLLLTALLPNGLALAADPVVPKIGNWTNITNPSSITSVEDRNNFGSEKYPVKVTNRIIKDVKLVNSKANNNAVAVKVNYNPISYNPSLSFVGNELTIPTIAIDRDGKVTPVEVSFSNGGITEKVTIFYQLDKAKSGATLKLNVPSPAPTNGKGTEEEPYVVYNNKLTGFTFQYDAVNDKNDPQVEVQLNSVPVQTFSSKTNPQLKTDNSNNNIGTINLKQGPNIIKVVAVNTGYERTIHFDYEPKDSPIILTDYAGLGTSLNTAFLYSESKITLRGVVGNGVDGSNLRLKIATNNGQNVQDLSATAPIVSGSNFTFYDVPLSSGMNVITFYERIGSVTKEHLQFFVAYNNTPVIDNLKANDTPLTTSTTLITVASKNRMTLNVDGTVKNAEKVTVRNATTNNSIDASVSSGTFAANVPSVLGENRLEFTAYSNGKTVGVIVRNVHVVTRDKDTASQLYNVQITNTETSPVDLKLNETAQIAGPVVGAGNSLTYSIQGTALLQFEDTSLRRLDNLRLKFEKPGKTFKVEGIIPQSRVSKGNGFTEYSFVTDIKDKDTGLATGIFKDGDVYKVSLEYTFSIFDPENPSSVIGSDYGTVNGYDYKFSFTDNTKPRFLGAKIGETSLSESMVTFLNQSTATVKFNTSKMSGNSDDYTVTYNGNEIKPLDELDQNGFKVQLQNIPAGTGTLEAVYEDKVNKTKISVKYSLKVEISPYVQMTYFDGTGMPRTFESGYQATTKDDFYTLRGKVYNYDLTDDNIVVKLAGTEIKVGDGLTVIPSTSTTPVGNFTISESRIWEIIEAKGQGSHELVIELTTSPSVKYNYTILFISSKAPSINDIKLEILENGKTTELTKKATDTTYRTSSKFLSGFTFKVVDGAEHVYIEKNGKRIADFRYDNGDWDLQDNNQEYLNTLDAIPGSTLKGEFESLNFEAKNRTLFEAKMRSSEYGDLIESVQDQVSKAPEQENVLALFPLTLKKNGSTTYTIVAEDTKGSIVRYNLTIDQTTSSWEVISPVKAKESDDYIIVNSNTVPIKIFAENANKVLFGKTEAKVSNTTEPDFEYDDEKGREIPQTYYVFTATVPLKKGLNTIKYSVVVGSNTYSDTVKIFNANSSVNGAEYREVLGKKVSFSVFDKALELKFPSGTVLLSPENKLEGEEVKNPLGDIFVDVPLYFGIADRTTGQVTIPDDAMKSKLRLAENFNYASPLYYIDAGDKEAPGGRDPYEEDGEDVETFKNRYEENLVPSRAGSLSIKYDTSIVNAANNILTVFYHNGHEWQNVGGVVNTGKKTIQVPFKGFGYYIALKTRESFDDVVTHDFARDAMETLFSKGIMTNYSSNEFGANRDITRGEFATMLVKALDLPISDGPYEDSRTPASPTFSDVNPRRDKWDYEYKYIETAARAGIVRGKEPGYFRPDHPLTREEGAIMIARALNLKLGTLDASKLALGKLFEDAKDVGYYAAPSVLAVAKAKIMNGEVKDPNVKKPVFLFVPKANLTRAEMAVITIRVMVQLKKLPKQ